MDKARAIRADRAGANRGLVDFYSQVEVSEGIRPILHGVVADVISGVLGESFTQAMFTRPLVDFLVEVGCS